MASKRSADEEPVSADKKIKTSGDSGPFAQIQTTPFLSAPSFDAVFKKALDQFLAYAKEHFELSDQVCNEMPLLNSKLVR